MHTLKEWADHSWYAKNSVFHALKTTTQNRKIYLIGLITLIIEIGLLIPSHAALFRQLSTKDELSSKQTLAITKGYRGYIWIATHNGIDKYNGDGFSSYKIENSGPQGILTNSTGKVLAFTQKHVFYFNSDQDRFVQYEHLKLSKDIQIQAVFPAHKDNLWIGTNKGIYLLCTKSGNSLYKLENQSIQAIEEDGQNNLYVATNKGLLLLNYQTDKVYREVFISRISNKDIRTLYFDKETAFLWIGTRNSGVYVFNTHTRQVSALPKLSGDFPINKITAINDNKIWIGTSGGGILEFNRFNLAREDDYAKYTYVNDQVKANGINDILSSDNFIWVCTNTAGVFIYNKEKIADRVYKHIEGNPNSLANNQVNSLIDDLSGNIWFGNPSALSKYNERTGIWKNYTTLSNCTALTLDYDKALIAGRSNTILKIFPNGSTQNIPIQEKAFNSSRNNIIRSIYRDSDNNLWIGSSNANLIKIERKTGKTLSFNVSNIHKIIAYSPEVLYLCTNKRLYHLNTKSGEINYIDLTTKALKEPVVGILSINGGEIDPKNNNILWLSTVSNGLIQYNIQTKSCLLYTTENGLSSNKLTGLSIDQFGRVWIGSDNGLNCLDPDNQSFDVFHKIDGLPDDVFRTFAYTKRQNGNMIWGTSQGAIEFSPEQFDKKEENSLNLHFEGISFFSNTTQAPSNPASFNRAINESEEIALNSNQQSFSIRFFNLSYFSRSEVHYRWILENYDHEWVYGKSHHLATYTNIPAGKYIFVVQAFMADNPNHFITRKIRIIIAPPFWQTPFAYIAYLLIVIALIFLALKAYKKKLDYKYTQSKIQLFTHMAHDIRTPLTLIKAPLQELGRENLSPEANKSVELALSNTDKLLDMVTQLLDFQRIEQETMTLQVERIDLPTVFNSILRNFQLLAKSKDIILTAQIDHTVGSGWIDIKKVTTIMENILSNAIKYTPQKGNVLLDLSQKEHLLCIKIIDDGIGICAETQKKLFHQYFRGKNAIETNETGSGIGLLFTKKLIELHKGQIEFDSRLNVGTSFTITLPILEENYNTQEILSKPAETAILPDDNCGLEDIEERKVHLLLVEDNDALRSYTASLLAKTYTISQAKNGKEALDFVKKTPPDFIISDVLMPELSGVELCEAIKSNMSTCHIPVVLLSAMTDREDIIKGINAGADDYLTKPFDISVLEGKIAGRLKNRALYRQKFIDKKAFEDNATQSSEINKAFLNRIILFVEENITDVDLSIDSLAAEMAMSRSVFYKRIKTITNQNPKDLVRDIKMKKATFLLRENKNSISDIAYLTGHQNAKYFSTAFKKYYGLSPTAFIEQERKEVEANPDKHND